jgi:hypothetical protein
MFKFAVVDRFSYANRTTRVTAGDTKGVSITVQLTSCLTCFF